jgi:FKBP-type peptidyl-prolyl cis-trans isomerase FkpA
MNNIFKKTVLAATILLTSASYANTNNQEYNDSEKRSYVVGTQIGNQVALNIKNTKSLGILLNKKLVIKGITDAVNDNVSLTVEDIKLILADLSKLVAKKGAELKSLETTKDKTYLMQNKLNKNVKITNSGLQYEILKEGHGEKPTENSRVTVHYKGTLINGKEFDSSYKRNAPATFRLNQVIKGWTEGVQLMSVGSVYKFTIPSELAYGNRGTSGIPKNSTLIFEIELIKTQ